MASDIRIIDLPTADTITASTYLVGDNVSSVGTVKFTYTTLGNILANTVYADTMVTSTELATLERLLGINS